MLCALIHSISTELCAPEFMYARYHIIDVLILVGVVVNTIGPSSILFRCPDQLLPLRLGRLDSDPMQWKVEGWIIHVRQSVHRPCKLLWIPVTDACRQFTREYALHPSRWKAGIAVGGVNRVNSIRPRYIRPEESWLDNGYLPRCYKCISGMGHKHEP